MCHSGEHSGPSTAGASRWAHHMGWRGCTRSAREHQRDAAPDLWKHKRDLIIITTTVCRVSHVEKSTSVKFLTSRGYSVHNRAKLPFPLLRQTGFAECLKMCLHRGVHGQEIALEEATERCGGHFSYLENEASQRDGKLKPTVSLKCSSKYGRQAEHAE